MSEALIVSARRTPFGSFDGCLATLPATQLAEQVTRFILDESQVPVTAVDIGHPIGASGGRLAATVVRELQRRNAR